ncbi:MAG: GtrA family protein [Bacteroidota bacterium]
MKNTLVNTIDFFYPPFKRIMPLQTFRYAACGGGNMVLGFLIFTTVFHLIAAQQNTGLVLGCFKVVHTRINDADVLMMDLDTVAFKVHSFALSCSSSVVFVMGFLLNKYVVFTGSYLRGRIQLFRYFLASVSSFSINYFLLQALVLFLHVHPVLAQVIVTAIVVTISYFMQQYFTFKVKQKQ